MKDKTTYHILVIEDNPGDYLLVQDYLEEEILSPNIQQAHNFKQAGEILEKQSDAIDVVLLDLTLPDKLGEDLIKDVISMSSKTPVIILTGYTDVDFAIHSLSMGVFDYLLKDNLNSTVLYKSVVYSMERNKFLTQLKESEQRYSDLFQLSPQPMWVYEVETLKILDVNEAASAYYGYMKEEFLQMTVRDLSLASETHKLNEENPFQLRQEDTSYRSNFHHKKKNGEEIIVDIRGTQITYKGKKAKVVLATDITERYKHIRAIEDQNIKLREIAWKQSHTVRAPLARIMGLIHLIESKAVTIAEKEEMLQHVISSANELDDIIKNIISNSKNIKITKN